jgi:RNA polymerase sigma-70 factor (ECF subfamily)
MVSTQQLRADVSPSDGDLVIAARSGEPWAQEALFKRYRQMVAGMSSRLVPWSEVDDLLQDSFVEAFRSLHRLNDPEAFFRWLASIVVRTAHKLRRRRRLLFRLGLLRDQPVDIDAIVSPTAPPDVIAEIHQVYEVLEHLPAEAQIALILRRIEGMSLGEIAHHMKRSLATVKRRLVEAELVLEKRFDLRRSYP